VEKKIIAVRWVTFSALIITAATLLSPVVEWSSTKILTTGLLIILAAAMLTWAVETWLRFLVAQLRGDSRVSENQGGLSDQDTTLLLAASHDLWSAHSQREIIEIVMRTGLGLLDATGSSFTMLDEWEQQSEALIMGVVPSGTGDEWTNRLVHASTRQACRKCSLREAGAECILGKDIIDPVSKIFCLPIMRGEREYGLVNFFFPAQVAIGGLQKRNLHLLSEYAKLALENQLQIKHGVAALNHLESSRAQKKFKSSVSNIIDAIRRELNIKSVILWSPPDNEYDIASMLFISIPDGKEESIAFGNDDLARELWQEVLKTNQPIARDFDYDHDKKNSLIAIPVDGETGSPIGMVICVYDSYGGNFSDHLPMLKIAAKSISIVFQNTLKIDETKYRAARDERFRLAREIHDGLAQTLAYLKIQTAQMLNYLNSGKLENLEASLTSSYQTLSTAYQDARREIDDMRFAPETNVQDWLVSLAIGFRDDTGMEVDVSKLHINVPLPLAVQSQLIRIVQEALNNVRQHAQAEKISLSGSAQVGDVVLEISDDGRGFEPDAVVSGVRYGLVGMRERTDMIGGEFQIISLPDKGTTVRVTVPLETHNSDEIRGGEGV
jgi:signal transduction histidine kinase